MRILALDSALAHASAALVIDQVLIAERHLRADRGQASALAVMARDVLAEGGVDPLSLDAIAATVGPGSFTGIRACLALAHGLALGAGIAVIGVTVPEALSNALPHLGHRVLWTAIDSRRGRIFLDRGRGPVAYALESLPPASGPVAVAGDAAVAVTGWLAATGADVMLTQARYPGGRDIAVVAERRMAGMIAPLDPQPLYVDPPAARLPTGGLRPPPTA